MAAEKIRLHYSADELKEFELLINEKLDKAKKEYNYMKDSMTRKNDPGTDGTTSSAKVLEDGADTTEKENINQLLVRQQKFIQQLEMAAIRIKSGTYGVCIDTGVLIPKDRLRAVPHTMHTIEAKLAKK